MAVRTRTFKLVAVPTHVHEPERYMVYFEQIEPSQGKPFSVDPLLDFFSVEDALRIGKLQFQWDIDQVFAVGDKLLVQEDEPLLVKTKPGSTDESSTPPPNDR